MAQTNQDGPFALPPALRRFAQSLFALMIICDLVEAVCRRSHLFNVDPYIYPFLREHYPDFLVFIPRFKYFHSMGFFTYSNPNPFMYPAPVAIIYKAFYLVPHHPGRFFLGFILASFFVACILFGRVLQRRGIASSKAFALPLFVMVCSYPAWFEFKQANMEIVLWLVVTLGLVFFLTNRGYSAAACFGLAASMKIYPVVYLGLLLVRRQYRQIVFGVGVLVVTTMVSLWLVYPSISVASREIDKGLDTFRVMYMLHKRVELGFDHSLLSLVKYPIKPFPVPEKFAPVLSVYLITVAVSGIALFIFRIRRLPVINQIVCLTVACVFFPPVSFEYTLMHLFVPLALLVLLSIDLARRNRTMPGLNACLCCLVVLLGALPELIVMQHRVGGQVKAIVLGILFYLALRYPLAVPDSEDVMLKSEEFGHTPGSAILHAEG